jgi:WD40 repeat protein
MRIFLSFSSRDRDVVRRVEAALRQRRPGDEFFLDERRFNGGDAWLPELGARIEAADAFLLLLGETIGPVQSKEYDLAVGLSLTPERKGRPRIVPVSIADRPYGGLAFLSTYHRIFAPDPVSETALAAMDRGLADVATGEMEPAWRRFEPYRGLPALRERDAAFFFGREEETERLLDLLAMKRGRVVVLLGQSGVGKSSLAFAGALSRLKTQLPPRLGWNWPTGLTDSRSLIQLTIRPGRDPLKELATGLLRLYIDSDADVESEAKKWVKNFREGSTIGDLLRLANEKIAARMEGEKPSGFVIYVDQGEELYSLEKREAKVEKEADRAADAGGGSGADLNATRADFSDAHRFSHLLADAVANERFFALISLRSDFYSQFQNDTELFEASEKFDVLALPQEKLVEVVRKPAEVLGTTFESPDMPVRIAEAAAREPGALPLLSDVLQTMWKNMLVRGDGRLRWIDQPNVVDMSRPLQKRADEFLALPTTDRNAVRRLFTLHLADVPAVGEAVRRRSRRSNCKPEEWVVAQRLADQELRLLTISNPGTGNDPVVEVAHEQLLQRWETLRQWLEEEREFLIWRTGAELDLDAYLKTPRADQAEALLTGLPLTRGKSWYERRANDLGKDLVSFVKASIDRDAGIKSAEIEKERRYAASKLKAERLAREAAETQQRFERERADAAIKDRTRSRWIAAGGVAASLILMTSMILLAYYWTAANQSLLSSGKAWIERARQDLGNGRPYAAYSEAGMVLGLGPNATGSRFVPSTAPESIVAKTLFELGSAVTADVIADYNYGSPVYSVAVSSDGTMLATGQTDDVNVRSLASGDLIAKLIGHKNEIHRVLFKGASDRLVSADIDGRLGFWDLSARHGTIECPHNGYIYGLAYSETANLVAVAEGDGAISLWDATSHQLLDRQPYSQHVMSVAFDPSGMWLVSGGQRGEIVLWSVARNEETPIAEIQHTQAHEGMIFSVEFSRDGTEILSSATDGRVLRSNASDLSLRGALPRQSAPMWNATYNDSLAAIVTTARDDVVRVFDQHTGKFIFSVDQDQGWIYQAAQNGDELVTASQDGHVKRFDVEKGMRSLRALPSNDDEVISGAFSPNGHWFAAGGRDAAVAQKVNVWRLDTSGTSRQCTIPTRGEFLQLAFSQDSQTLAIASQSSDGVSLWDPSDCSRLDNLSLPDDRTGFRAIAFSPDARLLAAAPISAKDGSRVVLFDLVTKRVVSRETGHSAPVWALLFHPSGKWLASGDSGGQLFIWDIISGPPFRLAIKDHVDPGHFIKALASSPDGGTLALGGDQGDLLLYDFKDIKATPVRLGSYKGMVNAISFSSDGTLIAAGADDAILGVWEAKSLRPVYQLGALTGIWGPFGFHPTKPFLAFDGGGGLVRIWDMTTGLQRKTVGKDGLHLQSKVPAAGTSPVVIPIRAELAPSCTLH